MRIDLLLCDLFVHSIPNIIFRMSYLRTLARLSLNSKISREVLSMRVITCCERDMSDLTGQPEE